MNRLDAVRAWAQAVVLVSLLLAMMEMILPENRVREAVRTVGGMILLLTVVGPILRWIGSPEFTPAAADVWTRTVRQELVDDGQRDGDPAGRVAPMPSGSADGWTEQAQQVQAAGWRSARQWQQEYLAEQAATWVSRWSGRPAAAAWQPSPIALGERGSGSPAVDLATAKLVVEVRGVTHDTPADAPNPDWARRLAEVLNLLPSQVEVKEVSS